MDPKTSDKKKKKEKYLKEYLNSPVMTTATIIIVILMHVISSETSCSLAMTTLQYVVSAAKSKILYILFVKNIILCYIILCIHIKWFDK